jgi:PhzF family phenazine biosynthesis protein
MTLPIYQVDAFSNQQFGGNPAAVMPLSAWLPTDLMQQIAEENNLSETVFFVPRPGEPLINTSTDPLVLEPLVSEAAPAYDIRWFTPKAEINLCGHATLASAFVLFNLLHHPDSTIVFYSHSGPLLVTKKPDGSMEMDFPAWMPKSLSQVPNHLTEVLGGAEIVSVHQHRDLMVELKDEAAVRDCRPNFFLMQQHFKYIIITAKGDTVDFVSRFFAPSDGINEDPVTGSAHSQLIPFWAEKLQKSQMVAVQLSARQGHLRCGLQGDRVTMAGQALLYMKGEVYLP